MGNTSDRQVVITDDNIERPGDVPGVEDLPPTAGLPLSEKLVANRAYSIALSAGKVLSKAFLADVRDILRSRARKPAGIDTQPVVVPIAAATVTPVDLLKIIPVDNTYRSIFTDNDDEDDDDGNGDRSGKKSRFR